ncbi:MAG: bifunctional anthranilate synthase component II/anthranilate phosphoribosyltransferase [Anaerolineae bacterium]
MIVVIDNYDSFTYNLVQELGELGAEIAVFRNDGVTPEEVARLGPSHIVISPGPGTPADSGISNEVIRRLGPDIPTLGVCLGHQCIGAVFGGRVVRAPRLMHGKTSRIRHEGHPLFAGVPSTFEATRYHSLIVETPLPPALHPIAYSDEGELMGLCHERYPIFGLQFHPESILTRVGRQILANFLAFQPGQPVPGRPPEAVPELDIKQAISRAIAGESLTAGEAESVMGQIMQGGATPAQIASFLTALRLKGETIEEVVGCARAMRRHVTPVRPRRRDLIDTCGTGGDGTGTFNISTTVAFVVAGAGLGVAKHGNRSVSSRSGSADVLEALGVRLELTPAQVAQAIDEVGIGFLFAPRLHPAMKYAVDPRREIGIRTVFNVLGPLTNPAGAGRQLLGVFDAGLVRPLTEALAGLGSERAMVVHGADGLDELSTTGLNQVCFLAEGQIRSVTLDPTELGLPLARLEDLRGGEAGVNAGLTRRVLAGAPGPHRDVVLLNAAAALVVGGLAGDLREGLAQAAQSVDSGAALDRLEALIAFTQRVGGQP